jgi:TRAP-type C4-dicarboxylate transport system permease small subunit
MGRLARAIDAGIFKIERMLVTIAGLVMTTTVFLDICFRAFSSQESQLAAKLTTMVGWFGVDTGRATYETLRDTATPAILVLLAFLAGGAIFAAGNMRRETPRPKWWGIVYGLATIALCFGFVEFILRQPSWLVCMILLDVGIIAILFNARQRGDWLSMGAAVIVGGLGSKACMALPQDYIWSQELSLILLAWMAFIGASMATRVGKHIQVDALSRLIPGRFRPWSRALGLMFTTVFCAYMAVLAYEHVFGPTGDFASGEIRPATGIPAWTIIMAMLVAFCFMTLRLFAQSIDALLNPTMPTQELEH